MRIVIAGAGEVGSHLAKMLSDEEQDIIVIDRDDRRLALLDNYNLMSIEGSAVSFDDLKSAGAGGADLFIAVTPDETRNVLACSIAKSLGARLTVSRVNNAEFISPRRKEYFNAIGVDNLIYPDRVASEEMLNALRRTWVRNWFELFDGELIVVGVKLRANSVLVGKRLRDLTDVNQHMHLCAIKRNREIIIPRGADMILTNDIVYLATTRDHIDAVVDLCGKVNIGVEKVLIMGGGDLTVQLALMAQSRYRIKIIEPDYARCEELTTLLPHCIIVNGDARDTDLLEEEGISDYDVFVALTDVSEANILGCMMAKEHGVRKTIASIENLQYINEAEVLNIGTVINKKLIASSRIVQLMLDADTSSAKCLALADAEVAELVLREGSAVTKVPVKDLRLPDTLTIAGVVRDGKGMLVKGNTQLRPGDHIVVFCLSGSIHKLDRVFK